MKMMTIIVWGLYDENSPSYEFSKKNQNLKKVKKIIFSTLKIHNTMSLFFVFLFWEGGIHYTIFNSLHYTCHIQF